MIKMLEYKNSWLKNILTSKEGKLLLQILIDLGESHTLQRRLLDGHDDECNIAEGRFLGATITVAMLLGGGYLVVVNYEHV